MKGRVKWFNSEKGYGFITPDDGGRDVFAHYTGIKQEGKNRRDLADGDAVEFTVQQSDKGPKAMDIVKA